MCTALARSDPALGWVRPVCARAQVLSILRRAVTRPKVRWIQMAKWPKIGHLELQMGLSLHCTVFLMVGVGLPAVRGSFQVPEAAP